MGGLRVQTGQERLLEMIMMEPLIETLMMRKIVTQESLMKVLRVTPRFDHEWSSNEVSPSLLRFTMSLGHWITLLGFRSSHRIRMSPL